MPLAEFQKECVGYCYLKYCNAPIYYDHDNERYIFECDHLVFDSEEEIEDYINAKGWMK